MKKLLSIQHTKRGFTLVELLVALSLFAIAMLMATGATLIVLDANAKSQSSGAVMTNLNIALDAMSRDLRTGTNFEVDVPGDPDGNPSITVVNQYGKTVKYAYDSVREKITKQVLDPDEDIIDIVAEEISIKRMVIYDAGLESDPGDYRQPNVRIVIQGEAGKKAKSKTVFDVQTTVTQRGSK
jgi:prepilin-type N-terminal cleavage/methylation domain-containing protein